MTYIILHIALDFISPLRLDHQVGEAEITWELVLNRFSNIAPKKLYRNYMKKKFLWRLCLSLSFFPVSRSI